MIVIPNAMQYQKCSDTFLRTIENFYRLKFSELLLQTTQRYKVYYKQQSYSPDNFLVTTTEHFCTELLWPSPYGELLQRQTA